MKLKSILFTVLVSSILGFATHAQSEVSTSSTEDVEESNILDELDPNDPNIENILNEYDRQYEQETGLPAHLPNFSDVVPEFGFMNRGCYRANCEVFLDVVKSEQRAYLYIRGARVAQWLVSTGAPGHGTPDFDQNPNGRIYDRYMSRAYPGGDFDGLGNMPYAVFIKGGYAVHGTGRGNWPKLGSRASHGCIRLHPDNAKHFNRLVRQAGVQLTWITVR